MPHGWSHNQMSLRLAEGVEGFLFLFEPRFGYRLNRCGNLNGFFEGS